MTEQVNMEPYECMNDFKADIKLMFDNARIYNKTDTIYYKYACQLDQIVTPMLKRLREVPLIAPLANSQNLNIDDSTHNQSKSD